MNNSHPIRPASPASEKQSFDQWLLSDRNIKLALYSGGFLIVLAGLIFVVANWARLWGPLPNIAKLAISLIITASAYLGGYILFKRPAYRLGGKGLLGIASGFMALNFFMLHYYPLTSPGLAGNRIWLAGAVWCCFMYSLTAYLTQDEFFTYLGGFAAANGLTALLTIIEAPLLAYPLAHAGLLLLLLLLAWLVETTTLARFTRLPFNMMAHLGMPVLLALGFVGWLSEYFFAAYLTGDQIWPALMTLAVGVLFYLCHDLLEQKVVGRWLWSSAGPFVLYLMLLELAAPDKVRGLVLMGVAFAYLGLVFFYKQQQAKATDLWPLTVTATLIAGLVTLSALTKPDDLALILLGDVGLLVLAAIIFQDHGLLYGATWLFIWPVYLYLNQIQLLPGQQGIPPVYQGICLGILGLIYLAAAYGLKDRNAEHPWQWSGPLLSAASFLSAMVPVLVWSEAIVATIVLVIISGLYMLVAVWLKKPALTVPAMLAANLATIAFWPFLNDLTQTDIDILAYFLIGLQWVGNALALQKIKQSVWSGFSYLTASLTLTLVYLAGLFQGGGMMVVISIGLGACLLGLAWLEQRLLADWKLPGLLTYLAGGVIFSGQFYFLDLLGLDGQMIWPISAALMCGLFFLVGRLFNLELLESIYGRPLRYTGLALTLIPLAGSLLSWEAWLVALTCGLVAPIILAEGLIRRNIWLVYLSCWIWVAGLWALSLELSIEQLQAYIIPAGAVLLGMAMAEKQQNHEDAYWLLAFLGLTVLMGSALLQSIQDVQYAFLLAVECLAALAWGIWARSRIMVQVGASMLLANCAIQIWPAFLALRPWVKIGSTGTILFILGLSALFWREQIFSTRRNLADEWRQWQP